MNVPVGEGEQNEEVLADILYSVSVIMLRLGHQHLEPSRENVRSISSGVTDLDLSDTVLGYISICINELFKLKE